MARRRLCGVLVGVGGLILSVLPASAWAGTYTWILPTAQSPGSSNPDRDGYGATPWSYVETKTISNTPGSSQLVVTPLGTFSTTIEGGLTGWYDSTDADAPFVAANRNQNTVGVVPSGAMALQGARDWYVAVGWTSPLATSQKLSITGTFTVEDQDSACLSRPDWLLLKQDGTPLASSPMTGGRSQPISASPTVGPGQAIYLVVGWAGASYSRACVTAGLGLSIQAPSSTPVVSLDQPRPGTHISAGQPTFSGHASGDFGDARTVTVRVYKGSSSSGTLVERLDAKTSGGSYSAPAQPPLANGTYTAVAEQDDLAGDMAFSAPVTLSVHNVAPQVVLLAPNRSVRSHTPQINGTAGTRPGDAAAVYIGIWKGKATGGDAMRRLVATRGADGRFGVKITPALPNGTYTAVAAQVGAGEVTGVSQPLTFQIRVPRVPVIGSLVTIDSTGTASLRVGCPAISGDCTGNVLVLTMDSFTPVQGGPKGPVRVMFAHVNVPAGFTQTIRRRLPGYVALLLRRRAPLRVRVSAQLSDSDGNQVGGSAVRPLRVGAPPRQRR